MNNMNIQFGYLGFLVKLESYSKAVAHIIKSLSAFIRYGALVEIIDQTQESARFLAVVSDVRETVPYPIPDVERLDELLERLMRSGAKPEEVNAVFQAIMSPTQGLIRLTSMVEVDLTILGRIDEKENMLRDIGRPPRPTSIVREPDIDLLQKLLGRANQRLRIGSLAYLEKVFSYLDLSKLNMHVAILGQTGSGKTETVKRILYEVARIWWSNNNSTINPHSIVMLDPVGEYLGYPYHSEETISLLEALAKEGLVNNTKLTIIVPYDPRFIGKNMLKKELRRLLNNVQKTIKNTRLLLFNKDEIILCDSRNCNIVSHYEALELINNLDRLVLSVPHPDIFDLEELEDIKALEEHQLLSLYNVAEEAELALLQHVKALHMLRDILYIANILYKQKTSFQWPSTIDRQHIDYICFKCCDENQFDSKDEYNKSILQEIIKAIIASLMRQSSTQRLNHYINRLSPLNVWTAYLTGCHTHSDDCVLGVDSVTSLIALCCEARSNLQRKKEIYERLEKRLLAISRAIYSATILHQATLSALLRRMNMLRGYTASSLNENLFNAIARRLRQGVVFIHLAPPSTGEVDLILALLLRTLLTDAIRSYRPGQQYVIVIEEAHNYAPASQETYPKKVLRRYAREGRKWGLSLIMVSQRPAGLDSTILSQAATLIALRMTNPEDIRAVETSVETSSQDLARRLPDLEQGQALVSGLAVPERRIPLLVRVEMLRPKQKQ